MTPLGREQLVSRGAEHEPDLHDRAADAIGVAFDDAAVPAPALMALLTVTDVAKYSANAIEILSIEEDTERGTFAVDFVVSEAEDYAGNKLDVDSRTKDAVLTANEMADLASYLKVQGSVHDEAINHTCTTIRQVHENARLEERES